jgi:hypothetical protein
MLTYVSKLTLMPIGLDGKWRGFLFGHLAQGWILWEQALFFCLID